MIEKEFMMSRAYEFLTKELNTPITVMTPILKASRLNRIFILNHFDETLYEIQVNEPEFIVIIKFARIPTS